MKSIYILDLNKLQKYISNTLKRYFKTTKMGSKGNLESYYYILKNKELLLSFIPMLLTKQFSLLKTFFV